MKKLIRSILILSIILILLLNTVFAYGNTISMYWDSSFVDIYSNQYVIGNKAIRHNRVTYLPVDDMLKICGYSLGWDSEINAVTAYKGGTLSYIITNSPVLWKGSMQYISPNSTMIYNNVFYMPLDMFEVLTDDKVVVTDFGASEKYLKRDLLTDTTVSNKSRQYGEIHTFNNVSLVNNFGMMLEAPTDEEVEAYTNSVNLIANTTPDGVNIYNIIVPTAAEFYAPEALYLNQTEQIKKVYSGLSERVIPINAVSALGAHTDENIYFRTDHHWTQRGAYYAYKELMQVKGEEVPHLSDFYVATGSFTGSLASFAQNPYFEQVMKQNPDTIEKFIPFHYTAGACYLDMYMKKFACPIQAVYYDANSYLAFIGGDMPMVVFTTDVNNGKKLLILKESFGNAFATWALNNYSEVYVVDARHFNNGGEAFNLNDFYKFVKYDDLVIINSASSLGISKNLEKFVY